MVPGFLKKNLLRTAALCGVDTLFRRINGDKLLVVMFHGVTVADYAPPIWTQLPLPVFRRHLEFLRSRYVFVSLQQVVSAIRTCSRLPRNAVLLTFDDGLRNNCTVAFPVLREMNIPAAVFLTVDFVGTGRILWFDELYFLLTQGNSEPLRSELPPGAATLLSRGKAGEAYQAAVESLKRCGAPERERVMQRLREVHPLRREELLEDFGMLDWEQVRTMHASGLVEFGVHTATHRILAELDATEWEREIAAPKRALESRLGTEAAAFCFPNGRPFVDFREEHLHYLRSAGYCCAFTTGHPLFFWPLEDRMTIGRLPCGNDETSEDPFFRLNASGAVRFARESLQRRRLPLKASF